MAGERSVSSPSEGLFGDGGGGGGGSGGDAFSMGAARAKRKALFVIAVSIL